LGETLSGKLNETGALVNSERRQVDAPLPCPLREAFQQITVGTADVEEIAIHINGLQDQLSLNPPSRLASEETRLASRLRLGEIRPL